MLCPDCTYIVLRPAGILVHTRCGYANGYGTHDTRWPYPYLLGGCGYVVWVWVQVELFPPMGIPVMNPIWSLMFGICQIEFEFRHLWLGNEARLSRIPYTGVTWIPWWEWWLHFGSCDNLGDKWAWLLFNPAFFAISTTTARISMLRAIRVSEWYKTNFLLVNCV